MVVPYYTDESRVTLSPDTFQQHWERVKGAASQGLPYCSCLLDLRARVEALEAAQHTHPEQPDAPPGPAPAGGLVERVADVFLNKSFTADDPIGARAVIREVAEWMEQQQEVPIGRSTASADYFAAMLREEANR